MIKKERGFTLLVSTVIVGTVLLLVALSSSRLLIQQLANTVSQEDFVAAKYLAEGCAEAALMDINQNASYAGNETLTIGAGSCTIEPVSRSGSTYTIETQATVHASVYRLVVQANGTNPPVVTSWRRVTAF